MEAALAQDLLDEANEEQIKQFLLVDRSWYLVDEQQALPPKFVESIGSRDAAEDAWKDLSPKKKRDRWAEEVSNVFAFATFAQGGALLAKTQATCAQLTVHVQDPAAVLTGTCCLSGFRSFTCEPGMAMVWFGLGWSQA